MNWGTSVGRFSDLSMDLRSPGPRPLCLWSLESGTEGDKLQFLEKWGRPVFRPFVRSHRICC